VVWTSGKTLSLVRQVGSEGISTDEILRALSPDIDQLLRLRFGIGNRRHSRLELAARFGVTVAAVRRNETRAFRHLRALTLSSPKRPLRALGSSRRAPSMPAAGTLAERAPGRHAS
jgi:sigma-70-like protein